MPPPHSRVRARRQSLLWLLRSLYAARMGLGYVAMTRGRHAAPDLLWATLTTCLFLDMALFLVAFFAYFPVGRRLVVADGLLRPPALAALVLAAIAWTEDPGASLGWARGPAAPLLLGAEFLLLPMLTLVLARAIARSTGPEPASASAPSPAGRGTDGRPR